MALAELNIRLGADLKGFDKAMADAQRSMERVAGRLSSIGNGLSIGITLPMLAFGREAVMAMGNMESLRLAMEGTMVAGGRSIADAHKELAALTEAAKAPGLDLEQAVQGSLRLQNVGFSAEKARGVLVQLANAIAMTGGTAIQLDGVTKQFSQMLAKGRILQEDLGIIQENMPAITQAMEKAFGTKSAEKLRAMSVSAEQFIDGVTKQLEGLPRVSGGLQNALVNAGSSLRQFFAGVGEELNKVLDLTGKSEMLSGALEQAALWFKTLSDEQKKSIVNFALIAAATGPVIKGFSLVYGAGASLVGGVRTLFDGFGVLAGKTIALTEGFMKLKTAMMFTVAGAVIAGVVALTMAFSALADNVRNANTVYNTLQEVQQKAAASIEDERSAIAPLLEMLKSETASREQKEMALKRLQEISPKYFGNLDLEAAKTGKLKYAVDEYVKSLIRQARVKEAGDKIVALDREEKQILKQKAALLERIEKVRKGIANLNDQDATVRAEENIAAELKKFQQVEDAFKRQKDALQGLIEENTDVATAVDNTNTKVKGVSQETEALNKKQKKALDSVKMSVEGAAEAGEVLGDAYEREVKSLTAGIAKLTKAGFDSSSKEVQALLGQIQKLKESLGPQKFKDLSLGVPKIAGAGNLQPLQMPEIAPPKIGMLVPVMDQAATGMERLQAAADAMGISLDGISPRAEKMAASMGGGIALASGLQQGFQAMAETAGPAFEGLANSLMGVEGAYKSTGVAALAAAMQIVKAALAASLAEAIKSSVTRGGGLVGVALAGLAVAGVNALFAKLQKSLSKSPKFAAGTASASGGLAIVGEYGREMVHLPRGARVDGAVRTSGALRDMMEPVNGNVELSGQFRIAGSDLVLVYEKARRNANRRR